MEKAYTHYATLREQLNTSETDVCVSIVMIAYNVEQYIADAIESVLNQRTHYKTELIIGEDCSTDGTKQIIATYAERYPELIKPIYGTVNIGLTPNCVRTHNACTGKYIALLDGDDYWTDENKLQQQITYLDAHESTMGCAHQSTIIFEDLPGVNRPFGADLDIELTIGDMLQHRKFHTSSLVYRKWIWDKTGGIPEGIASNERAIYPMVIAFGPIYYMKESMCVYRRNSTSISSRITIQWLTTDLKMIPWLKSFAPHFPYIRYRSFIHFTTYTYPPNTSTPLLIYHWIMFSFLSFSYFPKNLGDVKHGFIQMLKKLFKK